ncbi:hypothetical protein BH24GEM3_BH24GEM3_10470 [soil metagenome]
MSPRPQNARVHPRRHRRRPGEEGRAAERHVAAIRRSQRGCWMGKISVAWVSSLEPGTGCDGERLSSRKIRPAPVHAISFTVGPAGVRPFTTPGSVTSFRLTYIAKGAFRKPVRLRRGPATVRGPAACRTGPLGWRAISPPEATGALGRESAGPGRRARLPRARRPAPFAPARNPLAGGERGPISSWSAPLLAHVQIVAPVPSRYSGKDGFFVLQGRGKRKEERVPPLPHAGEGVRG